MPVSIMSSTWCYLVQRHETNDQEMFNLWAWKIRIRSMHVNHISLLLSFRYRSQKLAGAIKFGKRRTYHDDMLVFQVYLAVCADGGHTWGFRLVSIRLNPNDVHFHRQCNMPHQVCQKHECPGCNLQEIQAPWLRQWNNYQEVIRTCSWDLHRMCDTEKNFHAKRRRSLHTIYKPLAHKMHCLEAECGPD